jgi:flagellar P-ring protein precursor FlgI
MTLLTAALSFLLVAQGPPPHQAPVVVPVYPPPPTWGAPPAQDAPPSSAHVVTNPIETAPLQPPEPVSNDEVHVRILDLVDIEGVRSNQLQGLGLVTGLNGTGDKGNAARQALSNFIKSNQIIIREADVDIANVALVSVTCKLPPFAKAGTAVDVSVQSVNGATSLFGGQLLQSQLYGFDGEVYVVAQGSVPVGGFTASGKAASVTQNHPTVGLLTGGGIVEQEVPMSLVAPDGSLHLHLRNPSYVTAVRVAKEVTRAFALPARAIDAATVRVTLPPSQRQDPMEVIAKLNDSTVAPADEAVVVINERTGTVVAGAQVRISQVAVTHGNLTISIAETEEVSQPEPFATGETVAVDRSAVNAEVEKRGLQVVQGGTSVSDLAASLNRMGVSSRDLVAIFQAFAKAGALHARLEIL